MDQRQQQTPDMGPIDVSVRHQDDLSVPHLIEVETAACTAADHLQDRRALGVLEHVGHRGLLHIQDLAANREQRLELGVACRLRGAQRAVALHDEQFGAVGHTAATVGKFGRQRRGLQGVLAPLNVAGLTGGQAGTCGAGDLVQGPLRAGLLAPGRLAEPFGQLFAHDARDDATHLRGAQHLLGLPLELRLGQAHRHDRGQPFEDVVLGHRVLTGPQHALGAQLFVDRLGQGPLETGDVRATLGRGDDIDERPDQRLISRAPSQRNGHVAGPLDILGGHMTLAVEDGHVLGEMPLAVQADDTRHSLIVGQVVDVFTDAALEAEHLGELIVLAAGILHLDGQIGDQERRLPGPVPQRIAVETGVLG